MRFMIMVRATPMTERGEFPPETDKLMASMAAYHEELARAGVLLDAAGLQPSSAGWRVQWDGRGQRVVDGPYAESKELIAGYTLIQVRSREEAMEWARRFPNPMGEGRPGEVEVRPLYEMEDFEEKGIHGTERFRALGTL
ncbi:MAG: YciI family protein [Ramlibacter sp.]